MCNENHMVADIISLIYDFVVFDEVQLGTNLAKTLHLPHKAVIQNIIVSKNS